MSAELEKFRRPHKKGSKSPFPVNAALLLAIAIGLSSSSFFVAAEVPEKLPINQNRLGHNDQSIHDYLQSLQAQGFADLAVEYVEILEADPKTPPTIRRQLPIWQAGALVSLADDCDEQTAQRHFERAGALYREFLKANPKDALAVSVRMELAQMALRQGQRKLSRANLASESKNAEALRGQARSALVDGAAMLDEVLRHYRDMHRSATQAKGPPNRRQRGRENSALEIERELVRAELRKGLVDLELARTYPEKDAKRKEFFDRAAETFFRVYQRYRDEGAVAGIYAHLLYGYAYQLRGDLRSAIDVYDEVLVREPPAGRERSGLSREMRELFAQAYLYRHQAMNLSGKPTEVLDDPHYGVEQWVRNNRDLQRSGHYRGIQLEAAKALFALAEAEPAGSPARRKNMAEAMRRLQREVLRTPSPYRQEGYALRDQFREEAGATAGDPANAAEAFHLADEAVNDKQWDEAIAAYQAAAKLAQDDERKGAALHRLAHCLYQAQRYAEAIQVGREARRTLPEAAATPQAANVALLALYALAQTQSDPNERGRHFDELVQLAQDVERTWPTSREADKARRFRGVVAWNRQQWGEAAEAFAAVSPQSDDYADSQFRAAGANWVVWQRTDPAEVTAREVPLRTALESLDRVDALLAKAPTELSVDAALLRIEILLRSGDPNGAKVVVDRISPWMSAAPASLATRRSRIAVAALEVAIARNDLGNAEQLVDTLLAQPDPGGKSVTAILVTLGKSFQEQMDRQAQSGRPDEAARIRESLMRFLARLVDRPRQDFQTLMFLADSHFALEEFATAATLYQRIVQRSAESGFAPVNLPPETMTRVRFCLVQSLRQCGKCDEALARIDALLAERAENSFALTLEMEKGHVLRTWAATRPEKLADAVAQWNRVSAQLRPHSPKPIEYFEARWNLAACMVDQKRGDEAARVLRSTMLTDPECGGAEMRRRYEELLDRVGTATAQAQRTR